MGFSDRGSLVAAVIGENNDVDELLRISLLMDGIDEVADDLLFVTGGKDKAITVILGLLFIGPAFAVCP
jgi:hypothetical protein